MIRERTYIAIYVPYPSRDEPPPYMIPLRVIRIQNRGVENIVYGELETINANSYIYTRFPLENPDITYIPDKLKNSILYNDDIDRLVYALVDVRPRHLLKLQFQSPRTGESYYYIGDAPIPIPDVEKYGFGYVESPIELVVLPGMNNWALYIYNFTNIAIKPFVNMHVVDMSVEGVKDPYEIAKILTRKTHVHEIVFPGKTSIGADTLRRLFDKITNFTIVKYVELPYTSNIDELAKEIPNHMG